VLPTVCASRAAALLALPSCLPSLQSGEFTVDKGMTESAFRTVRGRASFELECPADKLELVVLGTNPVKWMPDRATQIGVTGCGRRGVYVPGGNGWVLNSASTKAAK
jgi:hypothetical protein